LKLLVLILSSLSLNLLSDSVLEKFNIIIKNDLTFNHRSLDSNNEISESTGSLIHDGEVIVINVDSPFKERYQISDKTIDIYDFDFNQSRSISLNELNSAILDYLIKGILDEELITKKTSNTISIKDNQNEIHIELNNSNNFFIKYKDNLGITNLVDFKVRNTI
jgi:hypothetical protein